MFNWIDRERDLDHLPKWSIAVRGDDSQIVPHRESRLNPFLARQGLSTGEPLRSQWTRLDTYRPEQRSPSPSSLWHGLPRTNWDGVPATSWQILDLNRFSLLP